MTEQNLNTGTNQGDENRPLAGAYFELDKESKLDTLSWYMVVFGFIILALAGLCFYLQQIKYRDFTLNGYLLGNYLLMLGIFLYIGGRAIKYYRRFKKKGVG